MIPFPPSLPPRRAAAALALAALCGSMLPVSGRADALPPNDPTVRSNMCIGLECADSESFGNADYSILRLKNVRTRVEFIDTTVGVNYPTNDWALQINDDGQYGQDYFAIQDLGNDGALPFRVMAGAPDNALFLTASGRVGLGTSVPQTGLHVQRDDGTAAILIEDTSFNAGARGQLTLRNNGTTFFSLEDTSIPDEDFRGRAWNFQNQNGTFRVTTKPGPAGGGAVEMLLAPGGDMTIGGDYYSNGGTPVPDYVFAADYDLRPLSEVQAFIDLNRHLPDVPSAAQVAAEGHNLSVMQMALLRKIEELTLYTLKLEAARAEAGARIEAQAARLEAQAARLDALEAALDAARPVRN